jgi:hypothetical protein
MGSNDERDRTLPEGERFVRTGSAIDSSVDDERVVLDTDSEVYYGLNRVGAYLWKELEEPQTVEELVDSTAVEFDVVPAECRDDVQSFLTDLLEADLVKRA